VLAWGVLPCASLRVLGCAHARVFSLRWEGAKKDALTTASAWAFSSPILDLIAWGTAGGTYVASMNLIRPSALYTAPIAQEPG
jgi:hypothetical protein